MALIGLADGELTSRMPANTMGASIGRLWPDPIALDRSDKLDRSFEPGQPVAWRQSFEFGVAVIVFWS